MMAHIFISYSHQDKEYAEKLARKLEQESLEVWIDDHIDYGTKWPHVIQNHLDTCSALIIIMTPQSYQSEWVQNELARAQSRKKPIFPLLLEGEVWLSVQATQYTDVRNRKLPSSDFYKRLAQAISVTDKQSSLPHSGHVIDKLGSVQTVDGSGKQKSVSYINNPVLKGGTGQFFLSEDGQDFIKIYESPRRGKELFLSLIGAAPKATSFAHDCLAWPQAVVLNEKNDIIGVIIPNVQKETWMEPISSYANRGLWVSLPPHRQGNFAGRVAAAICITAAVKYIVLTGYAHPDMTAHNVLVNPVLGKAVLIDLDYLLAVQTDVSILGTPQYAAPETSTHTDSGGNADSKSNRHTLAILLYELLLMDHPLIYRNELIMLGETELLDNFPSEQNIVYKEEIDEKHRHLIGSRIQPSILSARLRELFHKSFADGLFNPQRRPSPTEYEAALKEMADNLITCANPRCPWGSFPKLENPITECPICHTTIQV